MKMEAHGLEFNEAEYVPQQLEQLDVVMEESEPLAIDIAVSFENAERILNQDQCRTFNGLKEEVRREFDFAASENFALKLVSREGSLELSEVQWDQVVERC